MKNPVFFIANYLRDLLKRDKVVTRCIRCKRPLVDPESIKRGWGLVCWKKMLNEFKEESTRYGTVYCKPNKNV